MTLGRTLISAALIVGSFLSSGSAHPLFRRSLNRRATTTTIVSTLSGLCLDDTNGSTSNGTAIQQWSCTANNANQQWTPVQSGTYYQFINQKSGMCLDNGGSSANGTAVTQWECFSGLDNQLWTPVKQSDGSYSLVSKHSGYCLDVRDGNKTSGSPIQQWSCTNGPNQRWSISNLGTSSGGGGGGGSSNGTAAFNFGTDKMRGVNVGGWLVLEKWIRPSLFANNAPNAVDEWTFSQTLGKTKALAALTSHWNTWVTESDIQQLASYGINFLRIPIGYWALDVSGGEPYVQGPQIDYMKQAVTWAAKYGIYVIVDLHGVPGSQNGFDNSGHQGSIDWTDGGFSGSNVQRTLNVITQLGDIFSDPAYGKTVASIELVNEPANWGIDMNVLKQYYTTAYSQIRNTESLFEGIMIHDAFEPLASYWNGFMQPPTYQTIILDTHQYQCFDSSMNGWSAQQHLDYSCSLKSKIAASNTNLWTIVGEWSLATYSYGASQTNNQPYTSWPASYKQWLRVFVEKQMDAYEAGSGWVFWNFKMESGNNEWNYMLGVQQGWIPNPASARTNTC